MNQFILIKFSFTIHLYNLNSRYMYHIYNFMYNLKLN